MKIINLFSASNILKGVILSAGFGQSLSVDNPLISSSLRSSTSLSHNRGGVDLLSTNTDIKSVDGIIDSQETLVNHAKFFEDASKSLRGICDVRPDNPLCAPPQPPVNQDTTSSAFNNSTLMQGTTSSLFQWTLEPKKEVTASSSGTYSNIDNTSPQVSDSQTRSLINEATSSTQADQITLSSRFSTTSLPRIENTPPPSSALSIDSISSSITQVINKYFTSKPEFTYINLTFGGSNITEFGTSVGYKESEANYSSAVQMSTAVAEYFSSMQLTPAPETPAESSQTQALTPYGTSTAVLDTILNDYTTTQTNATDYELKESSATFSSGLVTDKETSLQSTITVSGTPAPTKVSATPAQSSDLVTSKDNQSQIGTTSATVSHVISDASTAEGTKSDTITVSGTANIETKTFATPAPQTQFSGTPAQISALGTTSAPVSSTVSETEVKKETSLQSTITVSGTTTQSLVYNSASETETFTTLASQTQFLGTPAQSSALGTSQANQAVEETTIKQDKADDTNQITSTSSNKIDETPKPDTVNDKNPDAKGDVIEPNSDSKDSLSNENTGAIVGGTVGGGVVLIAATFVIAAFMCRKAGARSSAEDDSKRFTSPNDIKTGSVSQRSSNNNPEENLIALTNDRNKDKVALSIMSSSSLSNDGTTETIHPHSKSDLSSVTAGVQVDLVIATGENTQDINDTSIEAHTTSLSSAPTGFVRKRIDEIERRRIDEIENEHASSNGRTAARGSR